MRALMRLLGGLVTIGWGVVLTVVGTEKLLKDLRPSTEWEDGGGSGPWDSEEVPTSRLIEAAEAFVDATAHIANTDDDSGPVAFADELEELRAAVEASRGAA